MEVDPQAQIVLYDLACIKGVCFSPVVWRIRLVLNYKKIPYTTVFLEFPDIEPTLKNLGIAPNEKASGHGATYTVPAIYHISSNTYLMDSLPIAQFLETTYPDRTLPLSSPLGDKVETYLRGKLARPYYLSIVPREIHILSLESQAYFRRTREATIVQPLGNLLDPEKEEAGWAAVQGEMREVSDLMRTNSKDGPFILGAKPSYTDFFVAGTMQSARMVDEGVFDRLYRVKGFKQVYEACLPFMEKRD